ncbi:MAG: hypothetical protein LBH43_17975 [Treponema sp.]|jgi:hypothetical protein|nr:hypothetical protein [Treponema sp.]
MSKWARKEDESKYKLSEESADESVRELLNFYEVDPSRDNPNEDKALEESLNDLSKAYRRGAFENKHDDALGFCVVQHLKNGDTLTYRELGGRERIAMDGFDNNRQIAKVNALLGKLCGFGEDIIKKLKGQEWRDARNLALVFIMASQG